jgi:hypothetical protein
MMFRRLQKQLQDTELGTGSGTTGTRTCTYVRVQWGYIRSMRLDTRRTINLADVKCDVNVLYVLFVLVWS